MQAETQDFRAGLAAIALITLWRLVLLPFDAADLFVDDAQYWFWGQTLDWGYYSKPPLIAWLLRLSTEIGGDGAFWIRAPLPLIHAGTAVVMALLGRRLFDARAGALAGVVFASLPAVAVGSLLVSTDTLMLFFYALAMLAQVNLGARASVGWALTLGVAVGFGLLAKYAMIYFVATAGLAAVLFPQARIGWRDAGIAAVVALALIAPNLAWNAANDFTTVQHTAYNADWQGPQVRPAQLLEFLANQFAVAGPVIFTAALIGLARAISVPAWRYPALMSLPILTLVSVQALISGANANWAAGAHLGGVLLAMAVLRAWPRILALGLAINLAATLLLPVAAVMAERLRAPSGELLLARYVGRADVSLRAADMAKGAGLDTLVSGSRAFLADAFYTLRDADLTIYAEPVEGFPPHHYAQTRPLPPGPGDVLYLTRTADGPACRPGATPPAEVGRWTPSQGFVTGPIYGFRVARDCWHPPAAQ